MDENTWRFAQVMMWLIGVQTTILIAAFGGMWIAISRKFDAIDKRLDNIESKLEKISERVNEIDKRVFGIETLLHMKDCCVLKDEKSSKQAQ